MHLRDFSDDDTPDEDNNDENQYNDVNEDDDAMDEDSTDEEAPAGEGEVELHAKRGYSVGIYGHVPAQPHRIRMTGRIIDSPTATRTLLAIMRINWPLGCIGTVDVNRRCPGWWQAVYEEFLTYFTHDPKCGTAEQAREAVIYHMRNNMRKALSNERRRMIKLIAENKGTSTSFLDHRPRYLRDDVWRSFCEYWDSAKFKKKQAAAKKSRSILATPHTSGATSFHRRFLDLKDFLGYEPGKYELFVHTHSKKGTFTSDGVWRIVERYLEICSSQNMDPNSTPIDTWIETVGVRKNTITGVPRTKASDIIPSKKAPRTRRHREGDESAGSTGRSVVQTMADSLVMQAVDRTLAYARANPDAFGLSSTQINILASSVAQGESDLPRDHPISETTMRELVHVMVATMNDIHRRHNLENNKEQEKEPEHEQEEQEEQEQRKEKGKGEKGKGKGKKEKGKGKQKEKEQGKQKEKEKGNGKGKGKEKVIDATVVE